jgi:hypothetical protein
MAEMSAEGKTELRLSEKMVNYLRLRALHARNTHPGVSTGTVGARFVIIIRLETPMKGVTGEMNGGHLMELQVRVHLAMATAIGRGVHRHPAVTASK